MEIMKWSEIASSRSSGNDGNNNVSPGAPTIKNHSVTYFANHLYCFGGYDGRRNHLTLLLYSIKEERWIRPHHVGNVASAGGEGSAVLEGGNTNNDAAPMEVVVHEEEGASEIPDAQLGIQQQQQQQQHGEAQLAPGEEASAQLQQPQQLQQQQPQPFVPPYQHDYVAGDRSILISGNPPPGRNGHSATLATDPDDEENARIIIIGGWLGTGPLAASDMHVLDISNGGRRLRWYQPAVRGTPPGPCNMHSADYVPARREVYVFRGGNGREYLNDLHALNVDTMVWRKVETTGEIPQQRANHSSAFLEETGELFVFGGWNGMERLNDIHILDTETSNWTCPRAGGTLPHPRAGMTLTALRGRIYLFGGSGTSSKCFQDLQILDRDEMAWLDVTPFETVPHGMQRNQYEANTYQDLSHVNGSVQQQHVPLRLHTDHPIVQDGMQEPPQFHFADFDGSGPQSGAGQADMAFGDGVHGNHRAGAFTSSRADWRSRELAAQPRSGVVNASPNPNDEDTVARVVIHGRGPGRRAGHTATAVGRKIYIFGGSCGADYLNDFYVLDTDPPPKAMVSEPTSLHLIERRMGHFFNDEEFSDVTFIVQGRKVYGHKMVLAIVSDCFRAMFTAGFRESSSSEIEITDCSYDAFLSVMEYIYTGAHPNVCETVDKNPSSNSNDGKGNSASDRLSRIVEILELADRFFLDHLKQVCETQLQTFVNLDSVEYLLQVAQKTNAMQLLAICEHLLRNRGNL
ncbi:galactose oxidase [Nitzschia inconspicua]|uniref:Galactose oxidase n=1 Tax=Nitzschia inconspicua TaxID=303405 RepID=A0A9K3KFD5_9STRA|nr:galactose oxidase [Nitzschia inconspicua]